MGKRKAKVSLKVKGTPEQVQKAIERLSDPSAPAKPAPILREADFRKRQKGKTFIRGVV